MGVIMKNAIAILGGLGIGAALMYMFDPERGNTRRALMRDKAMKLDRKTREAVSGRVHDLSNRAKGMLHEGKSAFDKRTESGTTNPQAL